MELDLPVNLRGVVTDEELTSLRQRNAARLVVAIRQLGPRWLLYRTPVSRERAAKEFLQRFTFLK